MALWHHLRRTGLQRLISNYQNLNFLLLPTRSFAVPAHIKAKEEHDKEQRGPRLNEAITAQRLRLVTDEGHSIVSRWEALDKAKRLNLDLVEVQQNPPVCKIMDFHKEKFKQVTKEKERTKSMALRNGENKEVRVNGKTELKDLKMKAETIIRLMERGYRVKCTALPIGKEVRAAKDDFLPKTKVKEKTSARKSGKEEDLLENDEKTDLSTIETEEYWAKKKLKQEALLGSLTRLLSLIDDVAIVESGPHVVGTKQAYIIVRHIKFETKKSGKKGVKPLDVLTNIQSSGPNKSVAVDNKDQNEQWEIEESESENDRVDIKKTANYQKPFVSPELKTEPSLAENKWAKESRPEVKIDSSFSENRYVKQNESNRYQLKRTESDSHLQVDPRQRPVNRNGTDGHAQFDPRRRQFNERDAHVQFDPKQRQHNISSNENFSPRSNAFVNEIKPKHPIFGNHNGKHPANPSMNKPSDPSPSTLNGGKFNAPTTMPAKSTADENKKSSSPTKSYGIFSRNCKTRR